MFLSPGIEFLVRSSADYIITGGIIYVILVFSNQYLRPTFYTPNGALLFSSFILRIGYRLAQPWIKEAKSTNAARAHGAVLPPHVKESHIQLAKSLTQEPNAGYPEDTWGGLARKYGNIYRFSIGPDEAYFTTEPEHVKAILSTDFDNFEKGTKLFEDAKSLFGAGVFNSDGDMCDLVRKERTTLKMALASVFTDSTIQLPAHFFTKARVSDFERHTDGALQRAKTRLAEGYPIDFQDLAARFTFDSATDYLFGHDIRSLDANIPYPKSSSSNLSAKESKIDSDLTDDHTSSFVKSFTAGQELFAQRLLMGPSWPLADVWKDKLLEQRQALDEYMRPFMERGLSNKEGAMTGKDEGRESSGTLLDYLISQTSDQSVIMDELFNLLLAGRDTRRLREEISATIGSERCPTIEDLRKLKYLRAFLNEVLRLYSIVPLNNRTSIKPAIFAPPTGTDTPIYIPAGERVHFSVFLMHRRKDLWGPDALEFDPDRFLDDRVKKYLVPNPFIFCPFNAGPRICLGQQFAYNEASFFIVRLLQQFTGFALDDTPRPSDSHPNKEWEGAEGPKGKDRIRLAYNVVTFLKDSLWVRMKDIV